MISGKSALYGAMLLLLTACSKDGDTYPGVLTDLVELETDHQSHVKQIKTDQGLVYSPDKTILFKNATPDSLYRVHCLYLPSAEKPNTATLYRATPIFSAHPVPEETLKGEVKKDPVKVISIWCSGNYINLHLGILTKGGAHQFRFLYKKEAEIPESVPNESRTDLEGITKAYLTLFHMKKDDPEAYTKEVFLSCPLQKLNLKKGSYITFIINTYEGEKKYSFTY